MLKLLVNANAKTALPLALLCTLAGCRGQKSEDPPVHPNLNMDFQTSFKAQEESAFFGDGRIARPLVPGAVAQGFLNEDAERYEGKRGSEFVKTLPAHYALDKAFLERGRERYNIFCTPCHGRAGYGDGLVAKRGLPPVPNFHEERFWNGFPAGRVFSAITHGVNNGNMPPYAHAIPVDDRWAIVAYVRALQMTTLAKLKDVPADIAASKGWTR